MADCVQPSVLTNSMGHTKKKFVTLKNKFMIVSPTMLTVFLAMPGGMELVVILIVVLLLFGGKKIPELMKGLGKGMREFTDAKNNVQQEIEEGIMEKDKKEEIIKLKQQLQ